ncbi:MAG: hypothetical protein IJS17_05420 [Clostridia bacterium]|nr:hypothetical protein [Clostridia bacterium]
MKKILAAILAPAVIFSSAASTANTKYLYDSYIIRGDMDAIAHRGYSAVAPENTLPAFELAGQHGFWGAECDIHITSDGVWIISHDSNIERMTDGEGEIKDMTYDELMQYTIDAGSNVEKYPGLKMPKIVDYLDICKKYGIHPVIEIKYESNSDFDSLSEILNTREEKDMFVIISFERGALIEMKKRMPNTPMYLLESLSTMESIDFCLENGIEGLDLAGVESVETLNAIHEAGLDTIVWTIDDMNSAQMWYEHGVRKITTDLLVPDAPRNTRLLHKIVWGILNLRDSILRFFENISSSC